MDHCNNIWNNRWINIHLINKKRREQKKQDKEIKKYMVDQELIKTYKEFKKECVLQGIIDINEIIRLFKIKLEIELNNLNCSL